MLKTKMGMNFKTFIYDAPLKNPKRFNVGKNIKYNKC